MLSRMTMVAVLSLLLSACAQQGTVRSSSTAGPSTDMEDSTGSLGREKRHAGAGDVYVKLAIAYLNERKIDVALAKAKTALEVEPSNAEGHNVIALIYERLREYGLAEYHFKQSIRYQPGNPYALNAYGSFLCQRGRFDEADTQFLEALKNPLYQTPEVALTNAGICATRNGKAEEAESYLRQALDNNPRLPLALYHMAKISFEKQDHLSARAYLQRYQAVAAHSAASLWLGVRNERILDDQNAVASYSLQLKNRFPDSEETRLLRESE